jgi:dolichyl-phosphate beta-glucosyltransferase
MSRTLLVIPHFRDTFRFGPFLEDLMAVLPSRFAILVSDDGSGQAEVARLRSLLSGKRVSLGPNAPTLLDPLLYERNTGKGAAVVRGWQLGKDYSLLAFADADGAVSASEILRAEQYFRSQRGYDALLGSRIKMLGRSIRRNPLRHVSGRIFATLVSVVSGLPAYDTQCGFKILSRQAFERVHPHLVSSGFAFDVELCLLLLRTGHSVVEFPLDWSDVPGSKLNLLRDSIRMTMEVFRIRRRIAAFDRLISRDAPSNDGGATHACAS